jgi:hypothetical protein
VLLGTGTACRIMDDFTLANAIVENGSRKTLVEFTCPRARDEKEVGGKYSLYYGAALNQVHSKEQVECTPFLTSKL